MKSGQVLLKRLHKNMVRSKNTVAGKKNETKKMKAELVTCTNNASHFHAFSVPEVAQLRQSLLSWYDENKRDLPWRKALSSDLNQQAYAVWVSEIMLQQTQVATVVSYYNKWMTKWPTLQDLAASNIEEVNEAWSGLGYYSRGRRLFEGSQKVVNEMDGEMPKTAVDLEKQLPGVGRYTAGAIASIALGEVTGLVDGNVIRVLTRLRAIGSNTTQQEVMDTIWSMANQIVDPDRPGDFNQSLMELGATVCTPKTPSCSQCPVRKLCRAYAREEKDKRDSAKKICQPQVNGDQKTDLVDIECLIPDCKLCFEPDQAWDKQLGVLNYPRKPKKADAKQEHLDVLIVCNRDFKNESSEFMICQRPQKGLLAGLWEFPMCSDQGSKTKVIETFSEELALSEKSLQGVEAVGEVTHMFSHVHHKYKVWAVKVAEEDMKDLPVCKDRPSKWITEKQLKDAAVSTGMRKVFKIFKSSSEASGPKSKRKRLSGDSDSSAPKRSQASISDFFKRK